MEDDSDSKRPARKRPRASSSPEAGDEQPPASTAGAYARSGSTSAGADADAGDTAGADADDVILERENTAWDVLEDRFKQNARDGNYFDLTDEAAGDGGRALSVADAEEAVEAMRRSDHVDHAEHADEATAVSAGNDGSSNEDVPVAATESPAATTSTNEPRQSPIIRGLNNMIHDTITELQEARGHLLAVMQGQRRPRSLQNRVLSIQRRTHRMQTYVNRHAEEVVGSTSIVERLEKMNLVVIKANALIDAVNDKFFRNSSASSHGTSWRNSKNEGGGGNGRGGSSGAGGSNKEVVVID